MRYRNKYGFSHMTERRYHSPHGGLPPQSQLLTGRAVFTDAYAVIPKGTFSDIVTSRLPHWTNTRAWVMARPLSGFAETFSQYIVEVAPGGGATTPETEHGVEAVLFVTEGTGTITVDGTADDLVPGSYVFLAPGTVWSFANKSDANVVFHWVRKRYQPVDGIAAPDSFVTHEDANPPSEMPETEGRWATTRFVDIEDMRHDMHVTIVSLLPGAVIPFAETHVMEHGLYVLQGKGVYRLNQDWVEVEAGDFMWLRAFCPQACYAGGPEPFRYLLYKDVNRHMPL